MQRRLAELDARETALEEKLRAQAEKDRELERTVTAVQRRQHQTTTTRFDLGSDDEGSTSDPRDGTPLVEPAPEPAPTVRSNNELREESVDDLPAGHPADYDEDDDDDDPYVCENDVRGCVFRGTFAVVLAHELTCPHAVIRILPSVPEVDRQSQSSSSAAGSQRSSQQLEERPPEADPLLQKPAELDAREGQLRAQEEKLRAPIQEEVENKQLQLQAEPEPELQPELEPEPEPEPEAE